MLTICSVSYHSAPYLWLNKSLLLGDYSKWLVAQNGPEENLTGFDVIPGVEKPKPKPGFVSQVSFHHGAALNKILDYVDSKYVLFLDPDFYLSVNVNKCLQHMQDKGLAAFGAPYYIEQGKTRIQEVPTVFCLFLDMDKVDRSKLNFSPDNLDNVIADTGYYSYKYLRTLNIDAVVPSYLGESPIKHTDKSLKDYNLTKLKNQFDTYFWQNKFFGAHCHMKLHLREGKPEELKERTTSHLMEVEKMIKRIRNIEGD